LDLPCARNALAIKPSSLHFCDSPLDQPDSTSRADHISRSLFAGVDSVCAIPYLLWLN